MEATEPFPVAEHSNEQTRSNTGQQPADHAAHSTAHISFPPVPDSEKASRHELRKKWRAPLYQLPLGMPSSSTILYLFAVRKSLNEQYVYSMLKLSGTTRNASLWL